MAIQTTKTTSWFERVGKSFAGIGTGILLVLGMVALLFWNEGRAVQTQRALDEGAGLVVSVPTSAVNPGHEGQLIHLSGPVTTSETLADPGFGITAEGLRLIRRVEMYQWLESSRTETKKNLGGSETQVTTYSYRQDWSGTPQDSSRFQEVAGHQNPAMTYRSADFSVDAARLDAFTLDGGIIGRIGGGKPMALRPEQAPVIRSALGGSRPVHIVDGAAVIGGSASQPRVGDYRIRYELVPQGVASIVARQVGEGLAAFPTKAGESLLLVSTGSASAAEMFASAASDNALLAWVLRGVGVLLLIAGFSALLRPLSVLASVLPLAGSIVGAGTGFVAAAAGLGVGALTIATAWLFYRPLVALLILALAAALIFGLRRVMRRPAATAEPAGA